MRNAVKATVDAYDGTVNLYAWDESDPLLKAWRGAFPGTVQDKADIPDDLMEHLRYPEDMFKAQRYQFARYHVTDPGDFYQGNNRWEVPQDPESPGHYQPPYRMFVNQPDGSGQSFDLTSVYVPRGKNNLASFVSVNSDATDEENYGTMKVSQLPDEQTPGPGQVANEMATSENVREALLKFSAGSDAKPVYGNLLTLPVTGGLMYVQPVYADPPARRRQLPRARVRDRVVRRHGRYRRQPERGARRRARRRAGDHAAAARPVQRRTTTVGTTAATTRRPAPSTSRSRRSSTRPRPPSRPPTQRPPRATRSSGHGRSSGRRSSSTRRSPSPRGVANPPRP